MHRVFCAVPEGLEVEYHAFHEVVGEVNIAPAMDRGVLFVPVAVVPRMKDLAIFRPIIEQNVREASYYVQVLAGTFGAPERDFAPIFEVARASRDPSEIAVLLKTLAPGSAVDPEAARLRSDPGLPCWEYGGLDEFRGRLRSVLHGWLARITGFDLRPAAEEDEPFLYELITGAMAERLAAHLWDRAMREPLLRMQYQASRQAYAGCYGDAEHSIVLAEGRPAGRVMVARSEAALRIVDITLGPEHRGKGLGGAILRAYLEEADRTGRCARLQVALTSPAVRLYQRLGFERVDGDEVNLEMERKPAAPPARTS